MSQEVNGSNVLVPICFKAEDGDFFFSYYSECILAGR